MSSHFIYLTLLTFTDVIAIYYMKQYVLTQKPEHIMISIFFYGLMLYIFYKILRSGFGIGITNILMSILSIICGLIIGTLVFGEHITFNQKIGATLGIIGSLIILWNSNN